KQTVFHCEHECKSGCSIHGLGQPTSCVEFQCPYLLGWSIHRPDTFQAVIERTGGNAASYVPAVPEIVPPGMAIALIESLRSVPAAVKTHGGWTQIILSLDQESDIYSATEEQRKAWTDLIACYS